MVSSLRKCGMEGKVCGRFLPSKEHDPHRLCIACRGKSSTSDDWPDERCRHVADYVEKLSLQHERKKVRKTKSSSSSFYGFSPSMRFPLGQLPSPADSGVVTMSASSSAMCAVMYAVAGPAVTAASFVPPPSVTPVKPSRKRHHVTDPKERERMMLEEAVPVSFKDIFLGLVCFSWRRDALFSLPFAFSVSAGRWGPSGRRSSPCLILCLWLQPCPLNELPEAPSERCKIREFWAALEDDKQPASLC